jgi:2'-5' RNA ligase superfamily protein
VQVHALFAESEALNNVAALRAALDPVRAARFPLHVTVAYAPKTMPSSHQPVLHATLELGTVEVWPPPDVGIYLSVDDQRGWLRALRIDLGEPDTPGYVPHMTLLHHRARTEGQDLAAVRRRFEQLWTPQTANLVSLVTVDDAGTIVDRVWLE